ncbi:GAF domain-containing protein [Pseudanabaena sp. FACHB-2040]|uniref:GAF domain-containing sensor histidine kinase n=1 Tax=Pseudanabaena sp. FACHB-2040 TaxID=2692859 RepID=UPI00168501FF|nr:GAF domain-containing protein [Pseudanabaena sp. FACHB-2040]MBD2256156.1 GAF domain-containing protein [Pseudanabaena sp. FACHB-2040]
MSQSHTGPAYEKQMVSLGRVLQTLRDAQTGDEAVRVALDHVRSEFDFEVSWIGLYDRVNHKLLTKACHAPKGLRFIRTHLNLTPGDVMEQVVIQQRPLIVADFQNEPRGGEWVAIAKNLALQSGVLFPIRRQDVCFGILLLGSQRWGISPTTGERAHLSMLMNFLGDALYQHEAEAQRQQIKRPDQPLLTLLEKLGTLEGLDSRLRAVCQETQKFIKPSRTRIFWFEPKGNYFWLRSQPNQKQFVSNVDESATPTLMIPIEDVRGFHQSLTNNQLIVVGEIQSSLKATVTERMMQLLKACSFMAAPILYQGNLLGFVAVEGDTARIWSEPEKFFLQGVARLVALALPVSETDDRIRQMEANQRLTSGVVRGIHSDLDWRKALEVCATDLSSLLSVRQFIVLIFDEDWGGYELCFQSQVAQTKGVPMAWPGLDDVDWQMLERSTVAVCVEDIGHDLKLMAWRPILHTLGVRSVMACNVAPGNAPKGVVLVCDQISRHWTPLESSLLEAVSRQLGLLLHQWQLQRQMDQQEHVYDSIQWGLRTIQRTYDLEILEKNTIQHLAQLLQLSAVALVSWQPGEEVARVSQASVQDKEFWVDEDCEVSVGSDAILNWALQTDGILPLVLEDLPDISRHWVSGPTACKFLVMALRTAPDHRPTAVLVAVGRPERRWAEHHTNLLTLMTNQLAWSRRHLSLVAMLTTQREQLEQLNWYKQHRFEELYRLLYKHAQRLTELSQNDLESQPHQQALRELESLMDSMKPTLSREDWQLHGEYQTTPLISLLTRLMERVNGLIQQQQLWTKVHNESNLVIGGDIAKIELVLCELMGAACLRSQPGGRIDIWCRQVDRYWLELSITDDGEMTPRLIEELQKGRPDDPLAPSTLDEPPGLHFAICKTLMEQMGGEFNLSRLEDNRILSRVLLPIASPTGRQSHRGTVINKPFFHKPGH